MGCGEAKEQNYPTLLCFFAPGDEEQKNYCLKIKDNFKHEKAIRFEIKSMSKIEFSIKFKINNKIYDIQNNYDNSEETMKQTLEKMYKLLDESK